MHACTCIAAAPLAPPIPTPAFSRCHHTPTPPCAPLATVGTMHLAPNRCMQPALLSPLIPASLTLMANHVLPSCFFPGCPRPGLPACCRILATPIPCQRRLALASAAAGRQASGQPVCHTMPAAAVRQNRIRRTTEPPTSQPTRRAAARNAAPNAAAAALAAQGRAWQQAMWPHSFPRFQGLNLFSAPLHPWMAHLQQAFLRLCQASLSSWAWLALLSRLLARVWWWARASFYTQNAPASPHPLLCSSWVFLPSTRPCLSTQPHPLHPSRLALLHWQRGLKLCGQTI